MATVPSVEKILIEVVQSLGVGEGQTKIKQKFGQRQYALENHLKKLREVVSDIGRELGLNLQAGRDLRLSIDEVIGFNTALERSIWTVGADQRQVLWRLLGYSYMPMLGRKVAFWQIEESLDTGMPGGRFWFLPHLKEKDGRVEVALPVVSVVDWLLDLLGLSTYKAANYLGAGAKEKAGSAEGNPLNIESNLNDWREGRTPRHEKIYRVFPDVCELSFNGTFEPPPAPDLNTRVEAARAFVRRKNLTADDLRHEIPMSAVGRIEAVLDGSADEREQGRFIELLAARYGRPAMKTIRQRFLVARAVQDGYRRLINFLCPKVDLACADPERNKVLQLVSIFQHVYNLTVDAYLRGGTWRTQDEWFESELSRIFPWMMTENLVSILPSWYLGSHDVPRYLGAKFSRHFGDLNGGEPLEDFIPFDYEGLRAICNRSKERLTEEQQVIKDAESIQKKLMSGSPWRTLQGVESFEALSAAVNFEQFPEKTKLAIVARMKELAINSSQQVRVILIELGHHLNGVRKGRPKESSDIVSSLLEEAEANLVATWYKALLLQFKAKDALSRNDFVAAERHFRDALDACYVRSYGTVLGEVSRDLWALIAATMFQPLENQEKFYRNALFSGIVPPLLKFEDAHSQIVEYYWTDLYKPYPGFNKITPRTKDKAF